MKICEKHGEYETRTIEVLGTTIEFGCPTCQKEKEEEREAQERAEAIRNERERIILWQSIANIPQRYKSVFSYVKKPNQKVKEWNGKDNIVCIGGVGGGKTHYLCYLGNKSITEKKTVRYTLMSEIEQKIKDTWGSKTMSENTVINDLVNCDILIIDEIGRGNYSEYLFRIFDGRYNLQKPTLIAGNVTADEVKTILGDAIVSRLKGHGVIVNSFDAVDLRLE